MASDDLALSPSLIEVQKTLRGWKISHLLEHRRSHKMAEWDSWVAQKNAANSDWQIKEAFTQNLLFDKAADVIGPNDPTKKIQGESDSTGTGNGKVADSQNGNGNGSSIEGGNGGSDNGSKGRSKPYQTGSIGPQSGSPSLEQVLNCNLISVPETASLNQVMTALHNHGILAVAIHNDAEKSQSVPCFKGIVSIYDILSRTVFQDLFQRFEADTFMRPCDDNLRDYIDQLMEDQSSLFNTRVGELIEDEQLITFNPENNLQDLLEALISASYHRVIVTGIAGQETLSSQTKPTTYENIRVNDDATIVTQTDLLRFLFDRGNKVMTADWSKLLNIPCQDVDNLVARYAYERSTLQNDAIKKGKQHTFQKDRDSTGAQHARPENVITVPDSCSALAAFRIMYKHGVHAVAVVDADGGLSANLSASDLRGISMTNLSCLLDNVFDFLEIDMFRKPGQIKADQLKSITGDMKLSDGLSLILESHIHHIWVVGELDRPSGIVTSSDILTLLALHDVCAMEP